MIEISESFVRSSFKNLRKSKDSNLRVVSCDRSSTRTECSMIHARLAHENMDIPVFVKFSPALWWNFAKEKDTYAITRETAKESPTYTETKFFALTNKLQDLGICDTFVRSYNQYLKESCVKHDKTTTIRDIDPQMDTFLTKPQVSPDTKWSPYYTMLITENIKQKYRTLASVLDTQLTSREYKSILFQIMYTVQCLSHIHMAHMDLHGGNILVSKRNTVGYNKYTYKNPKGVFHTVYVPITHDIKFIDLDGAVKKKADTTVIKELRKSISNKNIETGKVFNPAYNTVKVLHTFKHSHREVFNNDNVRNVKNKNAILKSAFKGKLGTPYFDFNPYNYKGIKGKANSSNLKIGVFTHKKTHQGLKINDEFIADPSLVVDILARNFKEKPLSVDKEFSQEGIFVPKQQVAMSPSPKVNSPSPKLYQVLLSALKKEVDKKCGKATVGRPKRPCSIALKQLRDICKEHGGIFDKRTCRDKKKPGRKARA